MSEEEFHISMSHDTSSITNAAMEVLKSCRCFLDSLDQAAYNHPSRALFGATVGQHVRHNLDHFAAAIGSIEGGVIDYDRRDRDTPIERDIERAAHEIERLVASLSAMTERASTQRVRVRIMLDASGDVTELESSVVRELAFATHHAYHHYAMMAVIAAELGLAIPGGFGKAPSTLHHERALQTSH